MEEDILLKLENVEICREENRVLHDACLTLRNGEFVYVIGKVGSGKSSLLKSLYCEIPILRGEARIMDYNLTKMKRKDIPYLRRKLGIVFQDFQLLTDRSVSKNLEFVLKATGWKKKSEIKERIDNVLRQVGMQDKGYKMPHELSGGLRQRVMIAMAMICRPKLVIADEPTTALDVTVEAQILQLMRTLRDETSSGIVIISHNLGVIAQLCDYVYVMYAGRVVEQADTFDLFAHPMHPYTAGLMAAVSSLARGNGALEIIPGTVPNLLHLPVGCSFSPRCAKCGTHCGDVVPELREVSSGHLVRCINIPEVRL